VKRMLSEPTVIGPMEAGKSARKSLDMAVPEGESERRSIVASSPIRRPQPVDATMC
jgi:hypothetical protein